MSKGDSPPDSQTKKAQLYPDLVKPVDRAINEAKQLHAQGYTVPGFTDAQQQGLGLGIAAAQGGQPQLGQALNYVGGLAGGQGQAPGQQFLQGLYQPGGVPGAGYAQLQQSLQQAMGGSGGLGYLQQTAAGQNLQGNPQLDAVLQQMNADTTRSYQDANASLEGRLSQAGRFSGAPTGTEDYLRGQAQQTLARELAGNEAQVRYGDYATQRGYQQQAALALPGALGTEIGTQTGAAQALQGNAYTQLQAQMAAAQAAGAGARADQQTGLQAAGMVPGLAQAQYGPANQLLQYGTIQQQQQEREQNSAWEDFQKYIGTLQGIGAMTNPALGAQAAANYQSGGQQMAGNILGLVGTVGGIVAAPYTGGASLALTAGGLSQLQAQNARG